MTVDRTPRVARQTGEIDESWIMTDSEFAALGDGEVAYIKSLSSEEAQAAYPTIDDLPAGLNLFALHAADGTPIALTDDMGTAIEHAMGDELEIAPLH
jgi:hypothetical protein